MRRLLAAFAALCWLVAGLPQAAHADPPAYAKVVATCGTQGASPQVGTPAPLTVDALGNLCINGFGGTFSVAIPNGADVSEGATTDSVCGGDTVAPCTLQARMQRLAFLLDQLISTQPALGQATMATSVPVTIASDQTLSGCTSYHLAGGTVVGTNSTSVVAGVHTLCSATVENTNGTIYYLRFYDSATAPTCSSATNAGQSYAVPANVSTGGVVPGLGNGGIAFVNGIAFCVTGGGADNDNTNSGTGVWVNLAYK